MIAQKENGEFMTKDGKLEITLSEYNKRTSNYMFKWFVVWGLIAFFTLSLFNIM